MHWTIPILLSSKKEMIKILKGGNSEADPQRPTLEKSYYVHQYPLAYVSIPKRTKAITQSLITNMVGTSETPFVTGINIDSLVAQWQDEWDRMVDVNQNEFETWFDGIKGQLQGDVATQLQVQLNEQVGLLQQYAQNLSGLQSALNTFSQNVTSKT